MSTAITPPGQPVNRDRESLLGRITKRILQSLELEDILAATVAEVRSFLGTDRVKIYKFHPDESGRVVAESIDENRLPSLLGLNFPADDIPPQSRELFLKVKMRSIVDVAGGQISQTFLADPETGELQPQENCYRSVDPCHIKYLSAMGVQSSLVLPIVDRDKLWGLLVSHHSQRCEISETDLRSLQMVVDLLSVAIARATLLIRAREKAAHEATLNRISTLLHSLSTLELQKALEETVAALQGAGGRLDLADRSYTCGTQPLLPEGALFSTMERYKVWWNCFQSSNRIVWTFDDLYAISQLHDLQPAFRATPIRGMAVVPLRHRHTFLGYLSVFRNEIETETLWAGRCDRHQVQPRTSFEIWKETQKGLTCAWTASEIERMEAIARQFSSAIAQYDARAALQTLNTNLEQQIQKRTHQWQQATERQRIFLEVVAKIRESLDLDSIFRTTTREIRQLLQAERAVIYRFKPNWGGEFLQDFESCSPEWKGVGRFGENENLEWDDTYLQETQGGRYRNRELLAVDDIECAGFAPCHIEILQQLQIRAFVTVPIFIRQTLWGLLAVYQHSGPRHWEDSEIQFLTQLVTQLEIALQQSELLTQTQQQTEQLAQALEDLQKTQTQLIQTEKMSSLGQLVAGVAHEINNPVNFIYGNLSHAREYVEELLEILNLYQQYCPQPHRELLERLEEIDLEFLRTDLPKILKSMNVGAERIRQIVLSLKNFSRLDEAEKKPVDIHEGIDSTLLILHHRLKAKGDGRAIRVVKEYGDLPRVECYAGQLNQVFMNVLSNAIDALEQGMEKEDCPNFTLSTPQIRIRTEMVASHPKSSWVAIRIADNGPGIPEKLKDRLFDPFFTTKPVGKGTGLGLSIGYHIVMDKHGGNFSFVSKPGQGTEFFIEIPVR